MPKVKPIEELEARELDALVAERLMDYGYFRFTRPDGSSFEQLGPLASFTPEFLERMNGERIESGADDMDSAPHFSTDPAASKQLRDTMRAEGWSLLVRLPGATKPFFKPSAEYFGNDLKDATAAADTEERAVALAALRAKGVTHA